MSDDQPVLQFRGGGGFKETVIRLYAPVGRGGEAKDTTFGRDRVEFVTEGDDFGESVIQLIGGLRVPVRLTKEELEKKIYTRTANANNVIDLTAETKPAPAPDVNEQTQIPTTNRKSDRGPRETSGINIFDMGQDDEDPNATTRVTMSPFNNRADESGIDLFAFDDEEPIPLVDSRHGTGVLLDNSGSGLLDLTPSEDDTSLGAGLLQDVYSSDSKKTGALFETPRDEFLGEGLLEDVYSDQQLAAQDRKVPQENSQEKPPGLMRRAFNALLGRGKEKKKLDKPRNDNSNKGNTNWP